MSLRKINFTKEDATNLYLENYRYKIYNELKIQEIQTRIKNKLLNKKEEDNIDLVFYKNTISGFNLSEMSGLLSNENDTIKIREERCINEEIIDKYNNDKNNDTNIDKYNINDTNINKYNINDTNIDKYNNDKKKYSKYIDLDAECSSNETEESLDENLKDLSFIDDENYVEDLENDLFYKEKEQEDKKILKNLKKKFAKKKLTSLEEIIINKDESEENENEFSNLDSEIDKVKFQKINYDVIEEENVEFRNFDIEFANMKENE